MVTTQVQSWGRVGAWPHHVAALDLRCTRALPQLPGHKALAFGMGRSYGDVCLNPGGALWLTRGMDRMIDWNEAKGQLTCEAGVLLRDIQRLMVPRGWMLPVTPGTQLVTVGGAIANDVHGKNHHRLGSFGDQVTSLRLLRTDGTVIDCGPHHAREWFEATVGGLGLTGVIAQATLQLRRVEGPWVEAESLPFQGLDVFFELADSSEAGWEHTVAWVDCLSGANVRGIFLRGNMAGADATARAPRSLRLAMPMTPPISLVNGLSLRGFNTAYYALNRRKTGRRRVHYEPFFYPLDSIEHWNRMYGPRGFFQYQCVLPRETGRLGIASLLEQIALSGEGSFLAVLKTFGDRQPLGLLSFPRPGVTLALDFPAHGAATEALFQRLDHVVRDTGGRLYPAKDSRMSREMFEQGFPALASFLPFRDTGVDSAFARRVMGYT